jgi:predicted aldo/keto reductase-like oxidoreductase
MKYRTFGKTGLQISALGFGLMRLPFIGQDMSRIDEEQALEMALYAIDHGVNYFDTAYPYHTTDFSKGGSSEPFLGKVLKQIDRDKVYIATKLPSWIIQTRKDMDKYLDEQLDRLGTDYIDFYLLHGLNRVMWGNLLRNQVFEFLNSAISSGKIHYAGFSFHDEVDLFKEIVDAYDWTFCQIQYNYFDEHFQAGREGLDYAAGKDLAVVVMEPLRGGSLAGRLPEEANQIFREADSDRSAVEWALRWVWRHPEVSVVLSGMTHLDHVKENVALAENISESAWTDKDSDVIKKAAQIIHDLQRVNCTACGYCLPCPNGVNIPRNFALCNDHYVFHDPAAKLRYGMFLSEAERASNCIQCGDCEEHCPQQISIRDELEHVVELFEAQ